MLAASIALGAAPNAVMGADEQVREVRQAREELRETRAKIRERSRALRGLERSLDRLATSISLNNAKIDEATAKAHELEGDLGLLETQTLGLQDQLGARNREAFILGPGAPILYLLTATSAAEAAARMSVLAEMDRRDGVLASQVERNAERLSRLRAELARLERSRHLALQQLEIDRAELQDRLARSRSAFEQLQLHKHQVLFALSQVRPFGICPVQGPHAIADDFGIWVHRTEKRGGDHIHQGNDIMAPTGTPIVAPFDGIAVATPNKLGGLAVNVVGEFGYVYNAHLSRYGTLGPVEQGDVIGYVGATGNTNAAHDHFEWHPGGGPAVDPHEFLLLVCP